MLSIENNTLFFRVEGELTVYQVEEYTKRLIESIDNVGGVVVDLHSNDKIDTAGFQLLVALKKTCKNQNKNFELAGLGGSAQNFMALFGFDINELEKVGS
jgi:anti-anti-sigma factor